MIETSGDTRTVQSGQPRSATHRSLHAGLAVACFAVAASSAFLSSLPHLLAVCCLAGAILLPGFAVICEWPDRRSLLITAGAVISLALYCLAGWAMTTFHMWHPTLLLLVVMVVTGLRFALLATRASRNATGLDLGAAADSLEATARPPEGSSILASSSARIPLALIMVGVATWAWSLRGVPPVVSTGWGLASVLPVLTWVGIVVTVLGWVAAILLPSGPVPTPAQRRLRGFGLAATVLVVYGLQPLTQQQARLGTVWVHLGFIDRIAQTGQTADGIDARFNWPGFFAGWATLRSAGVAPDMAAIARWYPIAVALVLALLTLAVARLIGAGERPAWSAVAVVMLGNWIEQDFISPQGTMHLVSLLVVYLTLRLMFADEADTPAPWRSANIALILVLLATIVVSHPLSPMLLGAQLVFLALYEWRTRRTVGAASLVLLFLVVLEVSWFATGVRPLWVSQLQLISNGFGNVGGNVGANVTGRLASGDPGLVDVRLLRLALAVLLLGWAAVGAFWSIRRRERWMLLAGLALAPWFVIPMQSYGGELFMRCLLFGLPFLALLATRSSAEPWGSSLSPVKSPGRHARPRLLSGVAFAALLMVSGIGVIVARGGNDGFNTYSTAERRLAEHAVADTPRGGSLFITAAEGVIRFSRIGDITYLSASGSCANDPTTLRCVKENKADEILATSSQMRTMHLTQGIDIATWKPKFIAGAEALGYRVMQNDSGGLWMKRTVAGAAPTPQAGPAKVVVNPTGVIQLLLGLAAVVAALMGLRSRAVVGRGRSGTIWWVVAAALTLVDVGLLLAAMVRIATS